MAVATHLGINLEDYDRKIRTFIPRYDLMLSTAAGALRVLDGSTPFIVDLGVGTGALADACLAVRPDARLCGVDEDAAMLDLARQRLGGRPNVSFVHGSFTEIPLPRCDAIVASLALHHVRTSEEKRTLYAMCHDALRAGGLLISADCFTASDPAQADAQRAEWRAHLEEHYTADEADNLLAAWAKEDVYFPLVDELDMLRTARLVPDVVWRAGTFAVVGARRSPVE